MSDIPYNVIILQDNREAIESVIDAYVGIINSCVSEYEKRVALEMFYDEISLLIAEELIAAQISKNAELMKELRQKKFDER
jgi:hypothetical protein